jgi:hypothetical protein
MTAPTDGLTRCPDCGGKYWDLQPIEKIWRCHEWACGRQYHPSFDIERSLIESFAQHNITLTPTMLDNLKGK